MILRDKILSCDLYFSRDVLVDLKSVFILFLRTELVWCRLKIPFPSFSTKSRINVCQTNTQLAKCWKCGEGDEQNYIWNHVLYFFVQNVYDKTKKCVFEIFVESLDLPSIAMSKPRNCWKYCKFLFLPLLLRDRCADIESVNSWKAIFPLLNLVFTTPASKCHLLETILLGAHSFSTNNIWLREYGFDRPTMN